MKTKIKIKINQLPKIYKPFLKLNSKKTNNPVKRWVKILTGEGYGNPFQYSCLYNFMGRGAWWATFQRVAELNTTD